MTTPVYFLPWEQIKNFPEWIKSIGAANHVKERDFTAIKMHFGEKGNKGFVKPEFARELVKLVKSRNAYPFLTDASTIYVGHRADALHHTWVAAEHGFTLGKCSCPIIIADGLRGNAGVDVEVNLKHFKKVQIANAVYYADSYLFLSHFKGHEISGFGGTLKNVGMGCATRAGKYAMHDKVHPEVEIEKCIGCGECVKWCGSNSLKLDNDKIAFHPDKCTGCGECILSCPHDVFHIPWDETVSTVQEKIVEYAYGVLKSKTHFSINFLTHITKFCDCYPDKGNSLIGDIGVLAGSDPVALDQASADLVNKNYGGDFFKYIFPAIDWQVQLAYAEQLGLGKREYVLAT